LADCGFARLMTVFRNPYFIVCCLLFWTNQFLERILGIFIPFVHEYLDDLLAMPVVLGISLQVFRWISHLKDRFILTKTQILVGVAYFAFLFEFLLPMFSPVYTRDFWDMFCYGVGAVFFHRLINTSPKDI